MAKARNGPSPTEWAESPHLSANSHLLRRVGSRLCHVQCRATSCTRPCGPSADFDTLLQDFVLLLSSGNAVDDGSARLESPDQASAALPERRLPVSTVIMFSNVNGALPAAHRPDSPEVMTARQASKGVPKGLPRIDLTRSHRRSEAVDLHDSSRRRLVLVIVGALIVAAALGGRWLNSREVTLHRTRPAPSRDDGLPSGKPATSRTPLASDRPSLGSAATTIGKPPPVPAAR